MISGLDAFLDALSGAGLEPTVEEIRDALWLSSHIAGADPDVETWSPAAGLDDDEPEPLRAEGRAPSIDAPSTSESSPQVSAGAEMYAAAVENAATRRGFATRSPAVPALRHKAALTRALRPLKRKTPSPTAFTVDEDATAERVAVEELWFPVLRPAPERWLDLMLVVDSSASMVVWRRTVAEFRTLAEQLGAFRRIRVVELDGDTTGAATVDLENPVGPILADPATLIDPAERQLVLAMTDGVGVGWRSGQMQSVLDQWAHHSTVAVIALLPQRMWQGAGLKVVAAEPWTWRPGVPNAQWSGSGKAGMPIPVVELSPRWLTPWSRLVAGVGGRHQTALMVATTPPARPAHPPPARNVSGDQAVKSFRATASPTAFRLACYLSAAWLNLPVMRLVQHLMVPDSEVSHLAEVFLGGLLKRMSTPAADPELAEYDFLPGVRDALNMYLTRSDLLAVVQQSSEFVAERFGQAFDFAAMLADPDGVELAALTGTNGGVPLAHVSANVLAKLGGRYRSLARRVAETGVPSPVALAQSPRRADNGASAAEHLDGDPDSSAAPTTTSSSSAELPDTAHGYFVAITVDSPRAVAVTQVENLARTICARLPKGYAVEVVTDLDRQQIRSLLADLPQRVPSGAPLLLYWHGDTIYHRFETALIASDEFNRSPDSASLSELLIACATSPASEILVIVDGRQFTVKSAEKLLGPILESRYMGIAVAGSQVEGNLLIDRLDSLLGDMSSPSLPALCRLLGEDVEREPLQGRVEIVEMNVPAEYAPVTAMQEALDKFERVRFMLQNGAVDSAEEVMASIDDVDVRSAAKAEIAETILAAGDLDRAASMARTLETGFHRAPVLTTIAEHFASRGALDTAAHLIFEAHDALRDISDATQRSSVLASISLAAQQIYGRHIENLVGARVIIVYTLDDRPTAVTMAAMLSIAGAVVPADSDRPAHPSSARLGWLENQCQQADLALVVISNNGNASRSWERDVGLVSSTRTRAVPVVLPHTDVGELPESAEFLGHISPVMLSDTAPASLGTLLAACAGVLAPESPRGDSAEDGGDLTAFLSHAQDAADVVWRVVAACASAGFIIKRVDLDHHLDRDLTDILEEAMRQSDVFIFLLSELTQKSAFAQREVEYALAQGIPVLALQVGPIASESQPAALATVQIIDYREPYDEADVHFAEALLQMAERISRTRPSFAGLGGDLRRVASPIEGGAALDPGTQTEIIGADSTAIGSDRLAIALAGATVSQIGNLGEETAARYLTDREDATIVTMGDSGMPRQDGRQDLDLVAVIDGELTAFEVKTQFLGQRAGTLTRDGNLPRPRMRPPSKPEHGRQASQPYVIERLGDVIETGDGVDGVNVRVIAVDLKSMLIQQFSVDEDGKGLTPIGKPADCTNAARQALDIIVGHRGHL